MNGSIWRFQGSLDDLAGRYDALVAQIPRESAMAAAGLPEPTVEHHPVHAAFVHGAPLAQ
ncbi:MAG TPA: hypothetical protein VF927_09805 [Solirubrobacteraceae bacterium]